MVQSYEEDETTWIDLDYLAFTVGIVCLVVLLVKQTQKFPVDKQKKRDESLQRREEPVHAKVTNRKGVVSGVQDSSNSGWQHVTEDNTSMVVEFVNCGLKDKCSPSDPLEWKFIKESGGVRLKQADYGGSSWKCLHVTTSAQVPAEFMWNILKKIEYLPKFDEMVERTHTLSIDEEARVEYRYLKYKAIFPTSSRDFVVRTEWCQLPDGRYATVTLSTEHRDAPPDSSKAVRGQVLLSGYIVKDEGTPSSPRCSFTLYSQIDLKGDIPSFVINQLGTDAPMNMLSKEARVAEAAYAEHQLSNGRAASRGMAPV
jgi:hypothetical protein